MTRCREKLHRGRPVIAHLDDGLLPALTLKLWPVSARNLDCAPAKSGAGVQAGIPFPDFTSFHPGYKLWPVSESAGPTKTEKRKLAAILAAHVVGFCRLAERAVARLLVLKRIL